jgi:hypothetical protein
MAKVKLSQKRYADLLAAERKHLDLLPVYDDLEACGEDCKAMREITDTELTRIQEIKKRFGPNA